MYGEFEILKSFCDLEKRDLITFENTYQHGWHGADRNYHPEMVIGTNGKESNNKKRIQLVYRKDQEYFLKRNGFKNVHAIGCPLIYLPKEIEFPQVKNSVLVVPFHTIPGSTDRVDETDFCKSIEKYLSRFEKVCFLIHRNCLELGLWTKTLDKFGYSYVYGAGHNDETSYTRLAKIFSMHEWVVTNYLGSHVPFSAFFGSKICIIEKYHEPKIDKYSHTDYEANVTTEILEKELEMAQKNYIQKKYPFLFNNCQSNFDFKVWANFELGLDCKKTPNRLKRILGWDFIGQVMLRSYRSLQIVFKIIVFCLQSLIMTFRIGPLGAYKFMKVFRLPDRSKAYLPVSKTRSIFYYPTPKNRLLIRKVLKIP
jgi:hypothetical protein